LRLGAVQYRRYAKGADADESLLRSLWAVWTVAVPRFSAGSERGAAVIGVVCLVTSA